MPIIVDAHHSYSQAFSTICSIVQELLKSARDTNGMSPNWYVYFVMWPELMKA